MVKNKKLRVAIYARRSIYSEESESINMQIDRCKEYFKNKECTFDIFIDEGFSGSNTNRPDFQRMISKINNNEFDIVVVYKIDRISRKMLDFINLFNELENLGVTLISVTEGADPSTPAGRFVMNILASVAEMERANTIQRVKDNMIAMGKMGRWTGGNPPIGYKSVKHEHATYLEVDDDTKNLAIAIFNKYLECESMNETSRFITKKYKKVSVATLSEMLRSPVYAPSTPEIHDFLKLRYKVFGEPNGYGYLTYNRREKKKDGSRESNSKNMIIAVSKHPALIDADTWLRAQSILSLRAGESKPKQSRHSYLNTLVYCAECKKRMVIDLSYITTSGERVYSFRCGSKKLNRTNCTNGSIKVEFLEKDFEKKLKNIKLDKNTITELLSLQNDFDYDKEIKALTKKVDKNNKLIDNLVNKIGMLSNEAAKVFIDKIESLTEENTSIQTELLDLEEKKRNQVNDALDIQGLITDIELFNSLDGATIEEKRKIVRRIIKKMYFSKKENTLQLVLIKLH